MPILEPPPFPTGNLATSDIISISRFLNDPTMVLRALRTIADQIFVGNKVLTGQYYTDSGAVIYEQIESIFADRAPQAVAPGAEYPLSPVGTGPAQLANVVKWGLDTPITDESIARQNFDVVSKAFIKIVNSMVQQIDSVIMSAVVAAITQSVTASAAWNGGGATKPNILRDVLMTIAQIRGLKQGYEPDTVLCDLQTYATAISDPTMSLLIPREDIGGSGVRSQPIFSGEMSQIARLKWLPTPNLPTTPYVAVLDSTMLGAMVDERLAAPGYVGSQTQGDGDDAGRSMIQVKTMREDKRDGWRIRARRTTTPIIIEPLAAAKITGF